MKSSALNMLFNKARQESPGRAMTLSANISIIISEGIIITPS